MDEGIVIQIESSPPAGRMKAYDWYRMFSMPEMLAIHDLTATDANVYAFMHVLEQTIAAQADVVANDPILQQALGYLQNVPAGAPVLTSARAVALLAAIDGN